MSSKKWSAESGVSNLRARMRRNQWKAPDRPRGPVLNRTSRPKQFPPAKESRARQQRPLPLPATRTQRGKVRQDRPMERNGSRKARVHGVPIEPGPPTLPQTLVPSTPYTST